MLSFGAEKAGVNKLTPNSNMHVHIYMYVQFITYMYIQEGVYIPFAFKYGTCCVSCTRRRLIILCILCKVYTHVVDNMYDI